MPRSAPSTYTPMTDAPTIRPGAVRLEDLRRSAETASLDRAVVPPVVEASMPTRATGRRHPVRSHLLLLTAAMVGAVYIGLPAVLVVHAFAPAMVPDLLGAAGALTLFTAAVVSILQRTTRGNMEGPTR